MNLYSAQTDPLSHVGSGASGGLSRSRRDAWPNEGPVSLLARGHRLATASSDDQVFRRMRLSR
jgi:hypothetical protein